MPELVLATANRSKVLEVARMLTGRVALRTLADFGLEPPAETGATYAANARLKAESCVAATGLPSLADDSGLEVAALDGRPGVHSARYADDSPSRIARLLRELELVRDARARAARFVCVVAFARPGHRTVTFTGRVAGRIAFEPAGTGGFGFDPVFYMPRHHRTMAELSDAEKDEVSHRGRALARLVAWMDRARPL